jgi:hypothetical protein
MIVTKISTVLRRRWLAAGLVVLVVLPPTGCGGSSRAHAVNPTRAREALRIALDQWKKGEDPRSLESSATPMTIQDFDWAGGARLIDYQVIDDGQPQGANLSVQVKLTLSSPTKGQGKAGAKKVWYLVGTSPSVTVFRDMLRR